MPARSRRPGPTPATTLVWISPSLPVARTRSSWSPCRHVDRHRPTAPRCPPSAPRRARRGSHSPPSTLHLDGVDAGVLVPGHAADTAPRRPRRRHRSAGRRSATRSSPAPRSDQPLRRSSRPSISVEPCSPRGRRPTWSPRRSRRGPARSCGPGSRARWAVAGRSSRPPASRRGSSVRASSGVAQVQPSSEVCSTQSASSETPRLGEQVGERTPLHQALPIRLAADLVAHAVERHPRLGQPAVDQVGVAEGQLAVDHAVDPQRPLLRLDRGHRDRRVDQVEVLVGRLPRRDARQADAGRSAGTSAPGDPGQCAAAAGSPRRAGGLPPPAARRRRARPRHRHDTGDR